MNDATAFSVADALAAAARDIHTAHSLQDTMDGIARATLASVPGFDHVGVSIHHRKGRIETVAGTDQLVWDLDSVQYELDEGPCVTAIRHEPVVVVEHARHDQRWPRYMPVAVRRGLRAQLGVQLFVEDEKVGGINLYSTSADEIDQDAVHVAQLFATHAAIALGHAQNVEQLNQALASRQTIGKALGILMERYKLDEDRAFRFMVRVSSTSNTKLREIAQRIIDDATAQHRPGGAGAGGEASSV